MKGFDRGNSLRSSRALAGLLAVGTLLSPAEAASSLTVLTATQRREVTTVARAEGELVAVEEVLAGLGVSATSDAKGGAVTLQRGRHELVLHHRKSLASVDGDLKLLSAPAVLEGGLWLVPVDSLPRLLGPFLERPVEWRAAPPILVVGPVSIPRLTVSTFVSAELAGCQASIAASRSRWRHSFRLTKRSRRHRFVGGWCLSRRSPCRIAK